MFPREVEGHPTHEQLINAVRKIIPDAEIIEEE
jgi:hypothetical protein